MKFCTLKIDDVCQDVLFDLASEFNRDNGFYSWVALRKKFLEHQYCLHTADVTFDKVVGFELHINIQEINASAPCYLFMMETPQILPVNGSVEKLAQYRKVFTWNDDLVGCGNYKKLNFPNPISIHPVDGFSSRDIFCSLIAGNKTIDSNDRRIIYTERVKAIRWFQMHASNDFHLYGVGWDIPVTHGGFFGKIERRFWRALGHFVKLRPFPSYRGKVAHKRDVLARSRFAVCYENVRDLPGYITEKIFDCFFSGCVPVYWGASNIAEYIPEKCFIDRRRFKDTEDVYKFIKSITEDEFKEYQRCITDFLQSDAAYQFSSEFFAETIVNTIVQDLGIQA
jgi:hypothetical protein